MCHVWKTATMSIQTLDEFNMCKTLDKIERLAKSTTWAQAVPASDSGNHWRVWLPKRKFFTTRPQAPPAQNEAPFGPFRFTFGMPLKQKERGFLSERKGGAKRC